MGHGSDFVVSRGAVVKVVDRDQGEGCFKSCICSTSGELSPCVKMPCTKIKGLCEAGGQLRGKIIL